ncbi:hypothetical protein DZA28_29255 [Pseudomonas alloputida]|uniref:Uncharacterized protein n=4 Tax=Pseudomonas TaxID=286 RepID=A0A3G1DGH3_PSEAI|nr:Hypothetical protein [Pseudomonas aeruginosa]AXQ51114.1 hypothetical protein DZC31_31000 [Stenotrophomonas rhizophila]ESW38349.1 hypothetical protein O164_18050 [Pseudomonas taiwanensis SJ9]KIC80961.1 hypothetical protein RR51_18645 [Pseudomonas sp. C5pp]OAH43458.1 hypothetical protein AYJ70_28045 [Pseudomonas monteilii]TRZ57483.1 hypothetical protein DZA28_29255 [Pseudomonas alloputida]
MKSGIQTFQCLLIYLFFLGVMTACLVTAVPALIYQGVGLWYVLFTSITWIILCLLSINCYKAVSACAKKRFD